MMHRYTREELETVAEGMVGAGLPRPTVASSTAYVGVSGELLPVGEQVWSLVWPEALTKEQVALALSLLPYPVMDPEVPAIERFRLGRVPSQA